MNYEIVSSSIQWSDCWNASSVVPKILEIIIQFFITIHLLPFFSLPTYIQVCLFVFRCKFGFVASLAVWRIGFLISICVGTLIQRLSVILGTQFTLVVILTTHFPHFNSSFAILCVFLLRFSLLDVNFNIASFWQSNDAKFWIV